MARLSLLKVSILTLAIVPLLSLAQSSCPQSTLDQIQTCLDTIETDESTRPGGPCTSTDWQCICNKQQGILACYNPCPSQTDADAKNFNDNNCRGQHGVTNQIGGNDAFTYSGSPITTTVAPGQGETSVSGATSTSASPTSTSSTSSSAPTTNIPASTSSSTMSRSSSSASPSASTSNSNGAFSISSSVSSSHFFISIALGATVFFGANLGLGALH
ncbi:hypothetical protein IE53DRAFT_376454 [Violaceomyces palustris]|uniref:Uncharacterized protein n=1 Tax=Violaceomyces palustris TaxID=1673888 RepID=A0ACD0P8Q3_9BASI|nr:hypothetical protein IE53DRAFT_376454 [Violaceomyces palustris]